ncbi:nitroreductase/quinone reductase family protein [Amycolatopsis nigrescens]|uniref:nitroreductase/quinone reductase family protein n=1 Tax=Amycolatopsis nigrescens TaxID=381445 RepID=UPI00037922DE|nr:nitroreductase/quinone reductase family protein [Amycolatopsis nigrescens]
MTDTTLPPAHAAPLPSATTTGAQPQLDASRLMRLFVRLNVALYVKPPSPARTLVNKFFLRLNVHLYRRSAGRIFGRFGNLDALLLTTLGRRSGRSRVTPVVYWYDQGRFVVVAVPGHHGATAGTAGQPAWLLNLRATPDATIDIGPERIAVGAEELTGAERTRFWRKFTAAYPFFEEFERQAGRPLSLVRLTPHDLRSTSA